MTQPPPRVRTWSSDGSGGGSGEAAGGGSKRPGPLARWLRAGLPLVLVAALAVAVVLTVRGVAPWSPPPGRDLGSDGDLGVLPATSPTVSDEPAASPSPAPSPSASPSPTPASYVVQPGQAFRLKAAIAAARDALPAATDFRISTFNALGHSHTRPGGDTRGYASSVVRTGWAWQLLSGADVDVIGFQEFQIPQVDAFRSVTGGAYDVYPGTAQGGLDAENSIAWRSADWALVEAHTIAIPYFGGNPRNMPYVKLRHQVSGQEVWFFNVHNPADKFGAAQRWRDIATTRERELVNRLRADGTPVILTGDMNDRGTAFCDLTAGTDLRSADGGTTIGGCQPPPQPGIDWIFGTGAVQFTSYTRVRDGLVRQTTDHPFTWAEAHIEPTAVLPGATG